MKTLWAILGFLLLFSMFAISAICDNMPNKKSQESQAENTEYESCECTGADSSKIHKDVIKKTGKENSSESSHMGSYIIMRNSLHMF